MINYLYIALGCFMIALIALSQMSCSPTWEEVLPPVGQHKLNATITVQEEWCMVDGLEVNGTATFIKGLPDGTRMHGVGQLA